MPTVLISIALLVVVFFAIRSIVKARGSCSGCSGCNACGTHTLDSNGEAVIDCSSCNHCGAFGNTKK